MRKPFSLGIHPQKQLLIKPETYYLREIEILRITGLFSGEGEHSFAIDIQPVHYRISNIHISIDLRL
jgi:hypothetical protein